MIFNHALSSMPNLLCQTIPSFAYQMVITRS